MSVQLHLGDCVEVMRGMAENSIDSIVTDPPYGLEFMGKEWDKLWAKRDKGQDLTGKSSSPFLAAAVDRYVAGAQAQQWHTVWAIEALRVAKPGAILMAFGGTRTWHRLACAIEDAGWELRDTMMWLYGSGFPKSADVSKMLDKQERKRWIDIGKAVDNLDKAAILEAWKNYSSNAKSAGLRFQKSTTEAGQVMPASDSAPAPVALSASPESSSAAVIIAELSLSEAPRTAEGHTPSAPASVEATMEPLPLPARSVGDLCASPKAQPVTPTFTALCAVKGWQSASTTDNLRAVEALRIWLGSKPSSRRAATDALCAALIADLKHIILSRSATYLSADTTQQTAFASATTATITESTAASLISFMADTLSREAIDKAAGAERADAITGGHMAGAGRAHGCDSINAAASAYEKSIPAIIGKGALTRGTPATSLAQLWDGWGTALKPAWEPIIIAQKPLDGTYAQNAEKWGVAGLWIEGGRIGTADGHGGGRKASSGFVNGYEHDGFVAATSGRWPSNLLLDEDTVDAEWTRYFYCAKASRKEREMGLEGMPEQACGLHDDDGYRKPGERKANHTAPMPAANQHPCVKPLSLMRYLVRLSRTPTGGVVLDPFMGSGTTGCACVLEGRDFIGIERESEYMEIARRRIEHWTPKAMALPLPETIAH